MGLDRQNNRLAGRRQLLQGASRAVHEVADAVDVEDREILTHAIDRAGELADHTRRPPNQTREWRAVSLRRIGAPSALVEAASENVLRETVLESFHRAPGDHPAAAAAHAIFHQRIAAVPGGPH